MTVHKLSACETHESCENPLKRKYPMELMKVQLKRKPYKELMKVAEC
jgi:hypothetical protein